MKNKDLLKKLLPVTLKIAFLAILLLAVIFSFTFCQNELRNKNRALQAKLENVQTSTFRVNESLIHLYDLEKKKLDGIGTTTSITLAEYFVLLEEGETWSLVRFDGDNYYIKTAELSHAVAETVNLY